MSYTVHFFLRYFQKCSSLGRANKCQMSYTVHKYLIPVFFKNLNSRETYKLYLGMSHVVQCGTEIPLPCLYVLLTCLRIFALHQ